MVCHSRAANFVLGPDRTADEQGPRLRRRRATTSSATLEHLGVFRVNWADETKAAMREEARAKGMSDKQVDAYLDRQTATRLQREPVPSALLTLPPEKYRRLVDPYDTTQDVALRARSYLHANCAQCHVEAGGGNAQMELEFTTRLDKMNVLDVKPLHHTFDLPDARLIAAGIPSGRSCCTA